MAGAAAPGKAAPDGVGTGVARAGATGAGGVGAGGVGTGATDADAAGTGATDVAATPVGVTKAPAPPLAALLTGYAGRRVYFHPLWGNHGDRLIRMGSEMALRRAGVTPVADPSAADLIVINGGAGMARIWHLGALRVLDELATRHPATPLVVLPSTWDVDARRLAAALHGRWAPCFLYAREQPSYERLTGAGLPPAARVGLDHDMALHLQGSGYLARLRRTSAARHILVVERGDVESNTGWRYPGSGRRAAWARLARQLFPAALHSPLRRLVTRLERAPALRRLRQEWARSPFLQGAVAQVHADHPATRGLPVISEDISNPYLFSFRHFERRVATAAVVVSTRLHVAILAALLGKPTYLKVGPWHKIRGVYEWSLAGYPHVRLMP